MALALACSLVLLPRPAAAATDHAFLIPSDTGPVHYPACGGPLSWTLHEAGIVDSGSTPAAEERGWQAVFDEVSAHTDYRFVRVPSGASAAISIHYTDRPADVGLPIGVLAPSTAGLGGIVALGWSGDHWIATKSAIIMVPTQLRRWPRPAGLRPWVARHELGHALGLGHTSDSGQVMTPEFRALTAAPNYQAGDLAGLRTLAAASCPGAQVTDGDQSSS